MSVRHAAIGTILSVLHRTGGHRLFRPRFAGCGSILMFHRVRPADAAGPFDPNGFLEITPEFFETVIHLLQNEGIEIVTMSEVHRRLTSGDAGRRFACLTFDDGFRDNYDHAFPICRRNKVPMVVYVCTGLVDRRCLLWGLGLERLVRQSDAIAFRFDGRSHAFPTATPGDKNRAFAELSAHFSGLPPEGREALAAHLSERFGIDFAGISDANLMSWDMVREMADSGLVEIGAHTVHHDVMARLDDLTARAEIAESCRIVAERLGRPVRHFAYPYGGRAQAGPRDFALCRELGLATAVTTRHGNLMPAHRDFLHSLPRLSINGLHQRREAVEVFLSGGTAALQNGFRQLVTE